MEWKTVIYAHLSVHTSLFSNPLSNPMTNSGLQYGKFQKSFIYNHQMILIVGFNYDVSIMFWDKLSNKSAFLIF